MTLRLSLPMFAGKAVTCYVDAPKKKGEELPTPTMKTIKVAKDGTAKVTIQGMGGLVIVE